MKRLKPDHPELARNKRPFNDGITDRALRRKLRRKALGTCFEKKAVHRWTEKLCVECRTWNHRDRSEDWCEHFKLEYMGPVVDTLGPNVQVFQPFYHPNAQPLGAWIRNSSDLKECLRLNHKEPGD